MMLLADLLWPDIALRRDLHTCCCRCRQRKFSSETTRHQHYLRTQVPSFFFILLLILSPRRPSMLAGCRSIMGAQ
jgi:hypothetical protein